MLTKLPYMQHVSFIARLYNKMMGQCVADNGLAKGQGQTMILNALAHKDGSIQRELAEKTELEPASITAALSDMEQKGLIERRSSADDRRIYAIYLTDEGRKVSNRVIGEYNRVCEEVVLAGFSDEEKAVLLGLLKRMHFNIAGKNLD